jgi:hypothetical protein
VTCVSWLMMWHSCMSREVHLVGHTNINITTGKRHSFVSYFKFVGTDECIQIIFVGPKTDEYRRAHTVSPAPPYIH